MKVTLLPSCLSATGAGRLQYLTSFIIDDVIAVDAGGIGLFGTPDEEMSIKHIFLTHSHIDHIASLPILVENVFIEGDPDCVNVYGSAAVLECLRNDIFNDRVWPDFIKLSELDPFLRMEELEGGKTVRVGGLRITPVAVNHVVPTMGFVIEDDKVAVIICTDSGPTEEIWRRANATEELKAVFLEATFPNAMSALAQRSKHLTPRTFAEEVRKVQREVPFYAVHLKARFRDQVAAELGALGMPNLELARFDRPYYF